MKNASIVLAALIVVTGCGLAYYFATVELPVAAALGEEPGGHEQNTGEASAESGRDQNARDPDRLWCGEHDIYEDECVLCHPEIAGKMKGTGAQERDPNRLWCGEHDIYEDECVLCHPEIAEKTKGTGEQKRDPNRLWCGEHDIYEDECVLCHPEIAEKTKGTGAQERDPNRLWCGAHSVYEDECVICHPGIGERKDGQTPKSGTALMCKEHRLAEIECGICHPERVGLVPVGQGMKIRFATADSPIKAGVSTALPSPTSATPQEFLGQVTFNQNRHAAVSPLGAGVITEVLGEVGDVVAAGEVLATLRSADLSVAKGALRKAQAEALLARQTLQREKDLHERRISARQDFEQAQAAVAVAESAVAEAQQHLEGLGAGEIAGGKDALLQVRAPFAGTIIERKAVRGTAAAPGDALFLIADLSNVWMELSVPEKSLSVVQSGGPILARFDAYPGLAFEGSIQWISPSLDPQTRMLKVRAELPNPQGLLKSGLFGRASLAAITTGGMVSVPASALQDVDATTVVFRKLEDDLYEARRVEVGARDGVRAVIAAGLAPDEEIVTEGAYIVKSELLKARLGAGCADH
jgi:cobalt-zinc-cadmium efflux system membrane fusion protein